MNNKLWVAIPEIFTTETSEVPNKYKVLIKNLLWRRQRVMEVEHFRTFFGAFHGVFLENCLLKFWVLKYWSSFEPWALIFCAIFNSIFCGSVIFMQWTICNGLFVVNCLALNCPAANCPTVPAVEISSDEANCNDICFGVISTSSRVHRMTFALAPTCEKS
jgi:hypothetical protein